MTASSTIHKLLEITAQIVSGYAGQKDVSLKDIDAAIESVFQKVSAIEARSTRQNPRAPAVSVEESIQPDYLICLEDGRRLKMLKRHLKKSYDMTPQQYREKWGLPSDYPMVAPNYAAKRSHLAKQIGLGTLAGTKENATITTLKRAAE